MKRTKKLNRPHRMTIRIGMPWQTGIGKRTIGPVSRELMQVANVRVLQAVAIPAGHVVVPAIAAQANGVIGAAADTATAALLRRNPVNHARQCRTSDRMLPPGGPQWIATAAGLKMPRPRWTNHRSSSRNWCRTMPIHQLERLK